MKILGIDPGSGIIGFGLIERKSNPKLVDAGVIRTTIGDTDADRLVELYVSIKELITEMKPDVACVDKLFFAQNGTAAMKVSQDRRA